MFKDMQKNKNKIEKNTNEISKKTRMDHMANN